MAAFEGNLKPILLLFFNYCIFLEFGVLPEIAKAIDELEWT